MCYYDYCHCLVLLNMTLADIIYTFLRQLKSGAVTVGQDGVCVCVCAEVDLPQQRSPDNLGSPQTK